MGWTTFGTNINPVTPIPRVDAPAWLTATFYRFGDVSYYNSKHYQCIDGHTSGVFATDLASGKWVLLADVTDTINMVIGINPLPLDAVKIIKNGVVLNRFSDYYFLNVRHDFANARTTGLVGFRQALALGDVLLMQYDSSYADYIGSALLGLEPRLLALETRIGSATSVAPRLNTLESRTSGFQSDILNINSAVGQLSSDLNNLSSQFSTLSFYDLPTIYGRLTALEKFFGGMVQFDILNEQLTPLEIPELSVNGNVHSSVRLEFELQRFTGTEYRVSTGVLHLALRPNGVWMTDRNITSFDMDGVEFSVSTSLDKICSVFYTSDLVSGASPYTGTMKVRKILFGVTI